MPRKPNVLTEFMKVNAQRLKLEKDEARLKEQIKEALGRGEEVRNRTHRAVLTDSWHRSISNEDFIETFDFARFAAVAEVSVTKVDALIKLGAIQEKDVKPILHRENRPRLDTQPIN